MNACARGIVVAVLFCAGCSHASEAGRRSESAVAPNKPAAIRSVLPGYLAQVKLPRGAVGRLGYQIGRITAVAVSPDGARFAVGAASGAVRLYDVVSKKLLLLQGQISAVHSLVFSPSGDVLLSADARRLRWWRVASGKEIHSALLASQPTPAFSRDGKRIFAAHGEWGLRAFSVATGKSLRIGLVDGGKQAASYIECGVDGCEGVARALIAQDAKLVLTCSNQRSKALRWNGVSGKLLDKLRLSCGKGTQLALSPDHRVFGAASGGELTLDLASGDDDGSVQSSVDTADSIAFVGSAKRYVVGTSDGMLVALRAGSDKPLWRRASGLGAVRLLASGGKIAVAAGAGASVALVRFGKDAAFAGSDQIDVWPTRDITHYRGHSSAIKALSFLADGTLKSEGAKQVRVWNVAKRKQLRASKREPDTPPPRDDAVKLCYGDKITRAMAPSLLALIGKERTVRNKVEFCDPCNDSDCGPHSNAYLPLSYTALLSPDRKQIAFLGMLSAKAKDYGKHIYFYDLASGKQTQRTGSVKHFSNPLAYMPDGKALLAVTVACRKTSPDTDCHHTLELWDVTSGKLRWRTKKLANPIKKVAISAGGAIVAVLDGNSDLHSVEAKSGKVLHSYDAGLSVKALAVSRDGKLLASGDAAGVILLWPTR